MVTSDPTYNQRDRFKNTDGLKKLLAYLKATAKTSVKGPQVDLAALADIPIGTLNHIIHGRRRPNLVHAMKLKRACKTVGIEIELDDWAMTDEKRALVKIDKRVEKITTAA